MSAFRSRRDPVIENLALRQQLAALQARGRPPRIRPADRAFWLVLPRVWPSLARGARHREVKPDTSEPLDHVIIFDEAHLRRLLREYVAYHHHDGTHLGLAKETPAGRVIEPRPSATAKVMGLRRCGGLHHRYAWRDAA